MKDNFLNKIFKKNKNSPRKDESFRNVPFDVEDKARVNVDLIMGTAIKDSNEKEKQLEEDMKEIKRLVDEFVKWQEDAREGKIEKLEPLKKLHLQESLFNEDDEENIFDGAPDSATDSLSDMAAIFGVPELYIMDEIEDAGEQSAGEEDGDDEELPEDELAEDEYIEQDEETDDEDGEEELQLKAELKAESLNEGRYTDDSSIVGLENALRKMFNDNGWTSIKLLEALGFPFDIEILPLSSDRTQPQSESDVSIYRIRQASGDHNRYMREFDSKSLNQVARKITSFFQTLNREGYDNTFAVRGIGYTGPDGATPQQVEDTVAQLNIGDAVRLMSVAQHRSHFKNLDPNIDYSSSVAVLTKDGKYIGWVPNDNSLERIRNFITRPGAKYNATIAGSYIGQKGYTVPKIHLTFPVDESFGEALAESNANIVKGKTKEEYMNLFGDSYENGELWDFPKEELHNGAIEPDDNVEYWEIDGRYYEAPNPRKDESLNESNPVAGDCGDWRGCKKIKMKWNGQTADPDLIYNGYTFNYWDIENALWEEFLEERDYSDRDSDDPLVDEEFSEYVCDRGPSYLDDVISGGYFQNGSKSWHDRYKTESFNTDEECQNQLKESGLEGYEDITSEYVVMWRRNAQEDYKPYSWSDTLDTIINSIKQDLCRYNVELKVIDQTSDGCVQDEMEFNTALQSAEEIEQLIRDNF